jgi:hypothetical protein
MGQTSRKRAGCCSLFIIALPAFSAEWNTATPFRTNVTFQFDSQRSVLIPEHRALACWPPGTREAPLLQHLRGYSCLSRLVVTPGTADL